MGGLRRNTGVPLSPPDRRREVHRPGANRELRESAQIRRSADMRPPLILFLLSVATTLLALYFLVGRSVSGHGLFHFFGVISGMVIGGALMGLYRQAINARQVSGNFSDWPVSSVALGTLVSIVGWLVGLANLVLVSIDISRAL